MIPYVIYKCIIIKNNKHLIIDYKLFTTLKSFANKFIFIIFFFPTINFLFSQNNIKNLDSLKIANDKVESFLSICEEFSKSNIDSCFFYANKALSIAAKNNIKLGIAYSYAYIGSAYYYQKDYNNSLKYRLKSLELLIKYGEKKDVSTTFINLCMLYADMGNYDKAFENTFKFLKINENNRDTLNVAIAYLTKAYIYGKLGAYKKAIDLNHKALDLFILLKNQNQICITLNNISSLYNRLNILDSARIYINKSYIVAEKIGTINGFAFINENSGRIYYKESQYDSAINCFHRSIYFNNILKSSNISKSFLSLAKVYIKINEIDSAKYYLDKANQIITKNNDIEERCDKYKLYADFYEKTNNTSKALKYYQLYNSVKDSILSETSRNKLIDFQIEYETERLKTLNEIQALKIIQNKNQRNFLVLLFVLLLILAFVIFGRFLLKKKTNRLLLEKNSELENVNIIKDKFFAIVAHDLKNQLTAFQNISKILFENYQQITDEMKHHLIFKINIAANKLYDVLENLLTWSSTQIKGIEFAPKFINLNEITNQVFEELKLSAEKKEILLENEISNNITALADENMVRIILRNLINNSIKFSNENTKVSISAIIKDRMVEVSVIDQGIGICETDKLKLFRIDINHKEIGFNKEKGVGLGLIISKTFIEKMRGNIWIENNRESGSVFTFSLPTY